MVAGKRLPQARAACRDISTLRILFKRDQSRGFDGVNRKRAKPLPVF